MRKVLASWCFGLVLASTLALVIAGGARAQDFGSLWIAPGGGDPMLEGNADEKAALQSFESGKPIRARELAEKIVAANPESFLGTWVLSRVFHLEEGRHPRARFLMDRALSILLKKFGNRPSHEGAIWWHKEILEKKSELLGEMEDREGQLGILDEHDRLYAPKLTRSRVWPLMKLGRYDEATEAAMTLVRKSDLLERISGYNGLMAVEDERRDRLASIKWGLEGIASTQERSCILHHNTSQAALTLFRFDEAEEHARKAIRAEVKDCPSSSYYHLTNIYLAEAEFNRAVSAYKKLMRARIEPRYRPMFDKDNKAILVEILLALGKNEEALKLVRQVYEQPDRPGMTSVSLEDITFASGVLFWIALEQSIIESEERASVLGFFDGIEESYKRAAPELKQWEVQRKLIQLAPVKDILVSNMRPFLRGVRPWNAGMLGRILGPGLARAALVEAERLDTPQLGEIGKGYFLAVSGELHFHAGDFEDAVTEGEAALKVLQRENAMLRLRTMAYVAGAYEQLGQGGTPRAIELFREVLHRFPTAIRQLDIRIPAVVTHDGDAFATKVAGELVESRRLSLMDNAPFRVHVGGTMKEVRICISATDGFRLGCGDRTFERGTGSDEDVLKAIEAFHTKAFSPMVELTSSDINSLDGSTVRANADEVLKGILGTGVKLNDEEEQ